MVMWEMSGIKVSVVSLLTAGLVLTGCTTISKPVNAPQPHTYGLNQQCPTDLTIAVGETIKFVADDNPSTGYSWQLRAPLNHLVATTSYMSNKTEGYLMVGVGGVRTFYFKATSVGTDHIQMAYSRSWAPQESAVQWACKVTVK